MGMIRTILFPVNFSPSCIAMGAFVRRAASILGARVSLLYVVDPASIPVERHKRRAKTDRLDAIKLVINLRAWLRGERDRMHVVHVP